jgi:hypothetical protein
MPDESAPHSTEELQTNFFSNISKPKAAKIGGFWFLTIQTIYHILRLVIAKRSKG